MFVTGWSCGNSSTVTLSLNCSNHVENLEDPFHPHKTNGSEVDYCTKCLCDQVCVYYCSRLLDCCTKCLCDEVCVYVYMSHASNQNSVPDITDKLNIASYSCIII